MKKLVLLSVLLGAMPITMMAQDDDLYFVPTKENVAKDAEKYGMPTNTYYAGSTRSADEYNRRAWSRVAPIDSAGNDIIDFSAERGVYPDSAYSDATDYEYTRRMSRFDDYSPSVAYWEGYRDGRWMSPWYYNSYYSWYDPWYYDPWYYGGYYGGYYGYYGWYSPYYTGWYSPWRYRYGYWGGYYAPRYYTGYRGTGARWSRAGVSHHKYSTTNHRYDNTGTSRSYGTRNYSNNSRSLGGYRSNSSTRSSNSGGSFGGGNRGGSVGGGGGRSTGGGHSYGGRR
ncbi:MAG: hypothetical protein IJ190_00155 [Prevotella sp.]|nr:hypothetical protein [Prevotella sp.]